MCTVVCMMNEHKINIIKSKLMNNIFFCVATLAFKSAFHV